MAIAAPALPEAPTAHRASLASSTLVIARRGSLKFLRTCGIGISSKRADLAARYAANIAR